MKLPQPSPAMVPRHRATSPAMVSRHRATITSNGVPS